MTPGYDSQVAPTAIIEELTPSQVIETISDTPIPSTQEGAHHLGRIHQVSHYNRTQNPTEVNLDAATLS